MPAEKDHHNGCDDSGDDSAQKIWPEDDRELGDHERQLCERTQTGNAGDGDEGKCQTDKVKDAVFGVKDKIMGTAEDAVDSVGSVVGDAGSAVGSTLGDAGSAIGDAPHKVAVKAQGSPLAVGLIAFGAGLLVCSLIPASAKEREAAQSLKSAAEPVTNQLGEAVKDVAQGLQEPARDAMENVKSTAADAAENVKEEGHTAVSDVKDTVADAKDHIEQAWAVSGNPEPPLGLTRGAAPAHMRRGDPAHARDTTQRSSSMAAADGGEPLPWPTYRILGVTARLEELRINRRLAHLHLTQGSLEALESLADREPAKISDLAALMSVSKQSLGKVLRRLESLGLLSKERGSDARSTRIRLTPHGRTVLATAEKLLAAMAQPGAGEEAALRRSLQQHLNDLRKN